MSETFSIIGDSVANYAYVGGGSRVIGTIIPDITVEEIHDDETIITDHPVETGASVSDHAYMMPSRLEMRVGTSDSIGQSEGYVQTVYDNFLSLQAERSPFSVTTGKRSYSNMLIRYLHTETNKDSASTLNLTVGLRQVRLTGTQTSGSSDSSASQQTSGVANLGTQSLSSTEGAPSFASVTSISYNQAPTTSVYGTLY